MSVAWDIRPGEGVGPLRFGMSEAEVVAQFGAFAKPPSERGNVRRAFHDNDSFVGYDFRDGALVACDFVPMDLEALTFQGADLLKAPTLDVVRLFGQENGGIAEAQGGSLYFKDLCVALLQYETSSARLVAMWSRDYDMHEPLRPVDMDYVEKYYRDLRAGAWPETDLFGEYQT